MKYSDRHITFILFGNYIFILTYSTRCLAMVSNYTGCPKNATSYIFQDFKKNKSPVLTHLAGLLSLGLPETNECTEQPQLTWQISKTE